MAIASSYTPQKDCERGRCLGLYALEYHQTKRLSPDRESSLVIRNIHIPDALGHLFTMRQTNVASSSTRELKRKAPTMYTKRLHVASVSHKNATTLKR